MRRLWTALLLTAVPSSAFAGAWTLPQGAAQVIVTDTASTASQSFDGSAQLASTPRYNKDELQALYEYGVNADFTAIFNPSLQHVDIATPVSAERTGLGFTEFGGRYRFYQSDGWVFSGQATLRVPGTFDTSNPAAIGYNEVEADFRALAGYGFHLAGIPAFIDLELAQRFRTAGAPSEIRADGTLGLNPVPDWLILIQSFNVMSEGAGSDTLFGASYDYFKFQLSAVYRLTPAWSLQGGGYTTYAGRNALQENGLLFAVWYQF